MHWDWGGHGYPLRGSGNMPRAAGAAGWLLGAKRLQCQCSAQCQPALSHRVAPSKVGSFAVPANVG